MTHENENMIHASDSRKLTGDLYCLGPAILPAYLLDGPEPVMFDAGMSWVAGHYLEELQKILGDRPLRFLFLSHMHFDHCGAAGHLKEFYPELQICASPEGAGIIQKQSALELIATLSNFPGLSEKERFKSFSVDRILRDNEIISLDHGNSIRVIATPGHTRDLLSFFLPGQKALLPSEAAGVPSSEGLIYSEFLVDCDTYFKSQQRLVELPFTSILFAHSYIYDEEDAQHYFADALAQGLRFRNRLSTLIDRFGEDHEQIISTIRKEEYDVIREPKQQEMAYLLNLQAKIRAVEKWRQQQSLHSVAKESKN